MTKPPIAEGLPRAIPSRLVIEAVRPEIDGGRHAIKRTIGESVDVEARIHADGHDVIAAVVRYRSPGGGPWREAPMTAQGNDRWTATLRVDAAGEWEYGIEAWIDPFQGWRRGLERKAEAGQDLDSDFLVGAALLDAAAGRAKGRDRRRLRDRAAAIRGGGGPDRRLEVALDGETAAAAAAWPDRSQAARYERTLRVVVDRERARFSAWYEMFPRSASDEPGRHGTLRDCERRLDYVASMGFDVLYLPPIHPIGRTHRKGPNNTSRAAPGDPGSPWAVGGEEGGHDAIHPDLGTARDLAGLVAAARERGIEVALDLAFQCSPDHPWVREHPDWFRARPDGSIQYAENPPKRYEDIYPIDFESDDWRNLWQALLGVVRHWVGLGIRFFRVDNPHTKPYAFWEWLIATVKKDDPEVLFLAEAFTRPAVMYRLAKLGFTQSYNYFPWRNTSAEIREYLAEITSYPVREFFRASLWPNTPDILPEYLQAGGRPAFQARLVLAATLGASYGIYGPPFELCENTPLEVGREEYRDSEKYEIRRWDLDRPDSLRSAIARLNRIRRENPALQSDRRLRFLVVSNDQLIAYAKSDEEGTNHVVVIVNVDPHHVQAGFVELPLDAFGIEPEHPFQMHDLLGGGRYLWQGARNYVEVDPRAFPAHVLRVRRRLRTEHDFDYYL